MPKHTNNKKNLLDHKFKIKELQESKAKCICIKFHGIHVLGYQFVTMHSSLAENKEEIQPRNTGLILSIMLMGKVLN